MSKIYEALKKAEQERDQARVTRVSPAAPAPELPRPQAAIDEEYQKLRTNLLTAAGLTGVRTILITAAQHGEGATTVALGLANALAKDRESRVLLIEANLRSPAIDRTVALSGNGGLSSVLRTQRPDESVITRIDGLNFSVMPAGQDSIGAPQAGDFEVLGEMLARVRPQFDFVVLDGPPVNQYADTSILATKVDGVILVVEADRTPVMEAEAAKRQLEKVGARILGVVLNRKRSYIPAFLESLL